MAEKGSPDQGMPEPHEPLQQESDAGAVDAGSVKFLDELLGGAPGELGTSDEMLAIDDNSSSRLSSSLRELPKVHVPSDFLPGVMSKVYSHHARTQVNLSHVVMITLLLLLLSGGFFVWDVFDYMQQADTSFSNAVSTRISLSSADIDSKFSELTGLLIASWQFVYGTSKLLVSGASAFSLVMLLLGVVAIAVMLKMWLSHIRG